MHEQIRKELATEIALRFSDLVYDRFLDSLHDVATEVVEEKFGDLLNTDSVEYYDFLMDVISRISITAV